MRVKNLHRWDISARRAVKLQRGLARMVSSKNEVKKAERIAGVDVSYSPKDDTMFAGVVVIDVREWRITETAHDVRRVTFPYVPGLLSFREAPAMLGAFRKLGTVPDVVVVDGQGVAHPRRLGIASHLGLVLDMPTIGCAKSRLCGRHHSVGPRAGDFADLTDGDEVTGRVLRTRDGVKPVYVSVGHKISLSKACEIILDNVSIYRLPEATRAAHAYVTSLRKAGAG
ncbi:MAG: deoxyribonuclease V [Planctomycetota bacterium]